MTAQLDLFPAFEPEGGWPVSTLPHPPRLLLGSCAWQHASFDRHFYPRGLPANRQIAFYSTRFNAVEVDSSFYRVPTPSTVERWVALTPEHFRFTLKAPKSLTHDAMLGLDQRLAAADWENLLALLPCFGRKLGSLLVQLAPDCTIFAFERLRNVVESIPPDVLTAVEFRHKTWNVPEVGEWLRASGTTRAWVDHYHDPTRGVRRETEALYEESGKFRYIRLLGDVSIKYNPNRPTGRNFDYGSVLFDRDEDLPLWVRKAQGALGRGMAVHLFINNHYQGFAPITAQRILMGLNADG
jgi:uncharacterized protein YecE (DUF72 family)